MNEIVHKSLGQKAHVYEQLRSIIEMQSNGDTQGAHDLLWIILNGMKSIIRH